MSNQEHIIDALKNVLADSYSLYLKTQNYHWNVEGPFFKPLHDMFEEQYNDLALAIDDIAELIRGLGDKAPGTFKAFQNITSIKDGNESLLANQMLEEQDADQDVMIKTLEAALHAAQKADDEVIIGAVIDRMTVHRKNKWMLKSSL